MTEKYFSEFNPDQRGEENGFTGIMNHIIVDKSVRNRWMVVKVTILRMCIILKLYSQSKINLPGESVFPVYSACTCLNIQAQNLLFNCIDVLHTS